MSKIKVAVIGVGNCFSSLYQGIHHYHGHTGSIPGISHSDIGGYGPADIEIVAAFDVDVRKVGRPVSEAIFAEPNCARKFYTGPFNLGKGDPIVQRGPVLDGVSQYMLDQPEYCGFRVEPSETVNVARVLRETGATILLNYLPVGSKEATEYYAAEAIKAGVSFVNNIPVLTLNHPTWECRFIDAKLPYIGSDIKSQFGASIVSQMLQELAFERGMQVDFHQQLNVGGNTDFNNMMVKERLAHKKVSKENVIRAQNDLRGIPVDEKALFAGPSTFIPYLKDNKVAYFKLNLRGFGDAPVEVDLKLSVQDSENSAGVVIDAIRFLQVAREMGIMGCLRGPSSFTQKSPPKQLNFEDSVAECNALARRKLSFNTTRQTTQANAKEFAWEEFHNGGMDYLRLVGADADELV